MLYIVPHSYWYPMFSLHTQYPSVSNCWQYRKHFPWRKMLFNSFLTLDFYDRRSRILLSNRGSLAQWNVYKQHVTDEHQQHSAHRVDCFPRKLITSMRKDCVEWMKFLMSITWVPSAIGGGTQSRRDRDLLLAVDSSDVFFDFLDRFMLVSEKKSMWTIIFICFSLTVT